MKKRKSFTHKILIILMCLTGVLIATLGIFLVSSYSILNNEIQDASSAFLKIYGIELTSQLSEMDGMLKNITTQGEDLAKIKSQDENSRSLSAISISNYIQNLLISNDMADLIVVYDKNYGICLDAVRQGLNYKNKNSLREYTAQAVGDQKQVNFEWSFITLDGEVYLYKMLLNNDRAIAVYVRASQLLNVFSKQDNGNRTLVLTDASNKISRIWGRESQVFKIGNKTEDIDGGRTHYISNKLAKGQLTLSCYMRRSGLLQQTHGGTILLGLSVFGAVLFMIYILYYTQKEITKPMNQVVSGMNRIRSGELGNRIDGEFTTTEFQLLKNTTNEMVEQIVGLKIQTYEKKIELQDMEMKSIRLQLKPHFFLNALTTISSLSVQGQNEQIKIYIDALSRNVRYMFKAGFHTVTVKEEIRHVENYFDMQELKYPGCVFHMIDMPKELEDWKIPQMLIHTLIENEYKYAISMDHLLTLLVKISKCHYQDQEMLLIEVEDDGKGYPEEVLAYVNHDLTRSGDKSKRVGLWSIRRILELMYDKDNLFMIENVEPHGCKNRIYVPAEPVHELKEEKSDR